MTEFESKLLPPGDSEGFSVGLPGNKKQENARTAIALDSYEAITELIANSNCIYISKK